MHRSDAEHGPLEWLAQTVGCAYLSDLKQPECRQELARALCAAPVDAWPARDWQEVGGYLTGRTCGAQSEQEIRSLLELERWLREA